MFRQLFFLLFVPFCFSAEIFFCVHSKAEAVDLEGLMTHYIEQDHKVHILAFGTAKMHLQDRFHVIELSEELQSLGCAGPFMDESSAIDALLPYIVDCDLYLFGLASKLQVDLINRLENKKIVGFIDGFYTFQTHPFIHDLDQSKLACLFVPWAGMIPLWKAKLSIPMHAVGKVDLEEKILRSPKKEKLTILYTGGYGADYEKDFNLFVKSMQHLQKELKQPHEILISLHPATHADGVLERKVLTASSLRHATIIEKTVPTSELMKQADILITAYSTTAIKALQNELPSMHVSFAFSNSLTKAKLLAIARSRRQFIHLFHQVLQMPVTPMELEKDAKIKMLQVLQPYVDAQNSAEK